MFRIVYHLVIAIGILFGLSADLNAQEARRQAAAMRKAVLVLPLQAGKGVPADKYLGFGAQSVLENMLVLHSDLEETFALRFYSITEQKQKNPGLFPEQKDLRGWLAGASRVPEGAAKLGFRYIVTGKINVRGENIVTDLELLDRERGGWMKRTIKMDFPRLKKFRESFLEMLELAGIPAPAAQKPAFAHPKKVHAEPVGFIFKELPLLALHDYSLCPARFRFNYLEGHPGFDDELSLVERVAKLTRKAIELNLADEQGLARFDRSVPAESVREALDLAGRFHRDPAFGALHDDGVEVRPHTIELNFSGVHLHGSVDIVGKDFVATLDCSHHVFLEHHRVKLWAYAKAIGLPKKSVNC